MKAWLIVINYYDIDNNNNNKNNDNNNNNNSNNNNMWKMKTKTIPFIVGALGMIKKGTQKYVNEIPGNLSLAKVQIKK